MEYINCVLFLEKFKENFAQLSVMNKLKSNHYSNLQLKTNVSSYFVFFLKGYESILALDFFESIVWCEF